MRQDIVFYFFICIVTRLCIAYTAYVSIQNKIFHYIMTVILFMIALGFLYQYITKIRHIGAFNQKLWWDFMRPIHFSLYLYASYLLYNNQNYEAFVVLCCDTLAGLFSFIVNHKLL